MKLIYQINKMSVTGFSVASTVRKEMVISRIKEKLLSQYGQQANSAIEQELEHLS